MKHSYCCPKTGEEMYDRAGWTRKLLRSIIRWALEDRYETK